VSYLLIYGILAFWVYRDSLKRKIDPTFPWATGNLQFGSFILKKQAIVPWTIGTFLLGPIVLPIYIARRPLMVGEVREGGTAWNILKSFALFWTVFMFASLILTIIGVGSQASTDAEQAGVAIGAFLSLILFWFFPVTGALILGLFLKKSSIVERGPTGRLATETKEYLTSEESPENK
jgi:hypothetical protein